MLVGRSDKNAQSSFVVMLVFQALFIRKKIGRVLALCLQVLFKDRCQSYQNNAAICIFVALLVWIFCLD